MPAGFLGGQFSAVVATMAAERLAVRRLRGVSQEQFLQQLYPQVRLCGAGGDVSAARADAAAAAAAAATTVLLATAAPHSAATV